MKNDSMLPTLWGKKDIFLNSGGTRCICHLAGIMSMDCSLTPKVQERSYFSVFANQILSF